MHLWQHRLLENQRVGPILLCRLWGYLQDRATTGPIRRLHRMSYTQTIQIKADAENHVQSFLHEIRKQADEASRYGVEIDVRRVDVRDKEVDGFES